MFSELRRRVFLRAPVKQAVAVASSPLSAATIPFVEAGALAGAEALILGLDLRGGYVQGHSLMYQDMEELSPVNLKVQPDRKCPLCDKDEAELLEKWSVKPWEIVSCKSCGMVFLRNPPPPELLKTDMDWIVTSSREREKRREKMGKSYYLMSDGIKKLRRFFRKFSMRKEHRYILRYSKGKKVLDVGCGDGGVMVGLPDDLILYGIEPSPGLHALADAEFRKRGGFCIHNISHLGFGDLPSDMSFDFVVMRSFLEHDVMAESTLRSCHSKLAPHGMVLIKVPNFSCWNSKLRGSNWPGIRNPDHVNYFTPSSLTRLLKKCGYSRVVIPLIWRLPSSDNL
jgi:2-polyprenyl-3-methyl-5-hydroxy-6-metoxy-1,4-benzoquinol methylase